MMLPIKFAGSVAATANLSGERWARVIEKGQAGKPLVREQQDRQGSSPADLVRFAIAA